MDFYTRINTINKFVKEYFQDKPFVDEIPAKDLMYLFIKAGIYQKDHKNGLPLRNDLRKLDSMNELHLIPFLYPARKKTNTKWYFVLSNRDIPEIEKHKEKKQRLVSSRASNRDEDYVIDLCDEVLNMSASRQHKFSFLLGDLHKDGVSRTELPVDAYYKELNLVVEYMERQHTEPVKHFDKPDVMTVSGVNRGEQRKNYDQRRKEVIPKHNIDLVIISYSDFEYNSQKKIIRQKSSDIETVKKALVKYEV